MVTIQVELLITGGEGNNPGRAAFYMLGVRIQVELLITGEVIINLGRAAHYR